MAAIVLIAGGAIQNFHLHDQVVNTLAGGQQTITGGPVASQEAIKEFGTNGGGFYNANSAHPFENPTAWTNRLEIFLLLVITFSLPRTFGRMVGDKPGLRHRRGHGHPGCPSASSLMMLVRSCKHHGTAPTAVGSAMEGVEHRFGVADSALFAIATTLTSTGAVDSFHDSYTSLGGMMTLLNMLFGEVAPGGTGSGLYGMLILAVITVFVAGLMVGRTPEYLGKKISAARNQARRKLLPGHPADRAGRHRARDGPARASGGYAQPRPARAVRGALRLHLGGEQQRLRIRRHHVNTDWYNTALGMAMLLGRFLPMVLVLALAGSLAKQGHSPSRSAPCPPTGRSSSAWSPA